MKMAGDPYGGRIFFVDLAKTSFTDLVDYLERQVVLFDDSGTISPPLKWMSADE